MSPRPPPPWRMTTLSKIQIALFAAGTALIAWESHRSARQQSELAQVQASVASQQAELDSRQTTLDELLAKNRQLQEAEDRSGNGTLLALMRERAAATAAAADASAPSPGFRGALTRVLDSPEQLGAEREHRRNQIRADMGTFFRLANASPEQVERFLDVSMDAEQRKAARLSALLHGTLSVADALRQRDQDEAQLELQKHQALGDSGYEFLNGIADGMRNDEAKRLLKLVQQNMGDNPLTPEQSDRLQPLFKSEIVMANTDEVDLFRPPDDWAREYLQHEENILQAASGFLTPAQIETLRAIGSYDLADRQNRMAAQRKSLGLR